MIDGMIYGNKHWRNRANRQSNEQRESRERHAYFSSSADKEQHGGQQLDGKLNALTVLVSGLRIW